MNERYMSRNMVKEPFHDRRLLKEIWGDAWGVSNGVDPIRDILMHRPGKEVLHLHRNAERIESGPVLSNEIRGKPPGGNASSELPDLDRLQEQHDNLVSVLRQEGIRIRFLEGGEEGWPERLFTRDLGMVLPGGVILSRFALYIRYGETRLFTQTLGSLGVPILGSVQGNGFAEGGSFAMLDERTALLGQSERVNRKGIEQVRQILAVQEIDLLSVDLPSTIIHLDEAFLMVDRKMALVNTALLPFWFLDELHRRDIRLLHVDPGDHLLSINALTVAPGRVVFAADGKRTMELLGKNGVHVIPVDVSEIFKLGGGIHCVTLPLIREPATSPTG